MKLKGRVPAIPTPLDEDEHVHEYQLRQLVEILIGKGVHGFWANGGFGGFAHLRDEEQVRAVSIIVNQVRGRVPVVAGITDNGATLAVERAERMVAAGADYLFLLPPSYGMWDNQRLVAYYQYVARRVQRPLLIYNDPWSTRVPIEAEVVYALGREDNIVGMKDSSENDYQYVALAQHFQGSEFSLLAGTMPLGFYALTLGFDGVVDPTDIIYTDLAVALFEAVQQSDWTQAMSLQAKIDRIGAVLMNSGDYRGAVESCLQRLGLCDRISPRPFGPLQAPDTLRRLSEMLEAADIRPVEAGRLEIARTE